MLHDGFKQKDEEYRVGDSIFCLPGAEDEPLYIGIIKKCWFDASKAAGVERRRILVSSTLPCSVPSISLSPPLRGPNRVLPAQVNWYTQYADINEAYLGKKWQELRSQTHERELFVSNTQDENSCCSIEGKVKIVNRAGPAEVSTCARPSLFYSRGVCSRSASAVTDP